MEEIRNESKDNSNRIRRKNQTLKIAQIGILAGVYAVATIYFPSYGPLNLRFSNILIGIVPIVGWPSVFGLTLGVFLSNIPSPLGPIDLISTVFSFIGLVSIQVLRKKSVLLGLAIYSIILSIWVAYEIHLFYSLPYEPTFLSVLPGISIIVIGLAYLFYKALKASSLLRRFESLNA